MRTIGLVGGLSWHSTLEYYTAINQVVNDSFKNNTNPPLLLVNMNQKAIHDLQKKNRWDSIALLLASGIRQLEAGGAEAVIICANTPHKVYHELTRISPLPILHIADGTGTAIRKHGLKKVGMIGTIYTMEGRFLTDRLQTAFSIETIVPESKEARKELQRIIEAELTYGIIKEASKKFIMDQIKAMISKGAEGIILGCTEFPLMITQDDLAVPVFNTTLLHARMAVDFILKK